MPPSADMEPRTQATGMFLTVLVVAILNAVLTGSMINVLLAEIRESFDITTARVSWVVAAFSLMYAVGIPLYGRVSDFIGTRTLFTAGLLAFAIGGLIAAIAPVFPLLVLGRLIQGAGGAAVPALALVMIARTMPPNSRGGAMGLIGSAVGVGQAIGPFIGGFIGGSIGWRFLFLGPMIAAVIIAMLAQRALPNLHANGERRFDIAGGTLLAFSIGLVLFGITQGQASGYGSTIVMGCFVGAAVATLAFTWRINAAAYPFVPPSLFRNRPYVGLLLVGLFNMMAYLSTIILVPLMLIEHNSLTPAEAGLVLTPGALAMAIISRYAGRLSDRIGPRIPVLAGLTTMLMAAIALSSFSAGADPWIVTVNLLVFGIGGATISAPVNSAASSLLTNADTGIGMGLISGAFFMGGGIGAAITGAWLNARQDANGSALNPLFTGDADPWSDGFLAIVVMVGIALAIASTIRVNNVSDVPGT